MEQLFTSGIGIRVHQSTEVRIARRDHAAERRVHFFVSDQLFEARDIGLRRFDRGRIRRGGLPALSTSCFATESLLNKSL